MGDLLDRSVGSLTLRELAALAKVAQTMSAALEAETRPETEPPKVSGPSVADGILAVVAGKALPKTARPEGKRGGHNADAGAEAKARALFLSGKSCREIAGVVDHPVNKVYAWSSEGKWRNQLRALQRTTPAKKGNGARLTKEQEEARDSNPDLSERWMR